MGIDFIGPITTSDSGNSDFERLLFKVDRGWTTTKSDLSEPVLVAKSSPGEPVLAAKSSSGTGFNQDLLLHDRLTR